MAELDSLRNQLIKSAKESVRVELSSIDINVVKSVNLLEDLDRIFNLMAEHCIEWYSTHFPELKESVTDNEVLLKLIAELGSRENFEEESIIGILKDDELAKEISKTAGESMGALLSEKDLKQISELAVNALKIKAQRNELEVFVSETTAKIAPNFSELAGGLLAARLISKAGSLKQLAIMPSSKIQLLGAEKALFRHLRSKGKALPPKYGLIFQHSLIQQLKPWQQGAMARSLAGKISIAARKDFFKSSDKTSPGLNDELKARFDFLVKKQKKERNPALKDKYSRENPMLPKKFLPREGFERKSFSKFLPRDRDSSNARPFRPRGDFRPRGEFQPRGDFKPRGEFNPRGDSNPRTEFNSKGDFKPRGDFKSRSDFKPRGEFHPRTEFKPRTDFKPREESKPQETFKPREGLSKMEHFNKPNVDFRKVKQSKDFRKNAFKKPGKLRFVKTKK
ncbi:MAG: NOP5/NOP56 family protein [Candidatus Diapherotrites archaeon]|nr:NOP5/NOP56 family protein [Candidatus Diapherotrites archaeon]